MDAITLLKDDHQRVKGLFREFEGAGERAYQAKRELARRIFEELTVHTKLEEEIFYPAVREKGDKEVKETIIEGLEEHHVVDVLIEELQGMDIERSSEQYDAKMKVLQENVEHHIEEEEKETLPEARKLLGDRLDQLGQQMEQRKQALTAQAARSGR